MFQAIVNCVLNSIASWHVLCPTTRTGRLTKGKFQALHCDRMSCPAFQCLRGLTSLTSPILCVCSVHIQPSTDSSLRDFMSINPSNSSGPQRTLRTIDTSMGASVPIRLKTQFSHVLRFFFSESITWHANWVYLSTCYTFAKTMTQLSPGPQPNHKKSIVASPKTYPENFFGTIASRNGQIYIISPFILNDNIICFIAFLMF